MSKAGKVLLLFGSLFFAALYVFRLLYGGWHASMWVPLILGSLLFFSGLAKERRSLLAFFALRTTKHGLNMGAVIGFALIGLTCVNIFAVRYEKKFDLTNEKINSLSAQSIQIAKQVTVETPFVLLYKTEQQNGESVRKAIGELISQYRNESSLISFTAINAIKDPLIAKQYDFSAGDFALFATRGSKKVRVENVNEEGVTQALIKLSHEKKKLIYFTMGHGERDLEATDIDGLSTLKSELSVNYELRTLTLYQSQNKVPSDASVVAVIRPTQQFTELELQALREYVRESGGHLLLAIDPAFKHNIAQLTKSFGIEFNNDAIIDSRGQKEPTGMASVYGSQFPDATDITKSFVEGTFALFYTASSLRKAPDAPDSIKVQTIIATDTSAMATSALSGNIVYQPNGPHALGLLSKSEKSEVIVYGDSDFLSNMLISKNMNNDLAMNSFSELADDKDLLSIRPRILKGTHLDMTRENFNVLVLLFFVPLPLILFLIAGFLFWRRRTA